MPQVIDTELQFETIGRLSKRGSHDACIVDEHIQPVIALGELVSKAAH